MGEPLAKCGASLGVPIEEEAAALMAEALKAAASHTHCCGGHDFVQVLWLG